ncbi:aldolase/citrate lyase family protein [Flavobacteriaceae bacterium]|nr:aldolase/citrate lyase family protein [Flavobacteriaceae bacterium]
MKENTLKSKLQDGKAVLGPFCKINDPAIGEIAVLSGFDFFIIDMEHGPYSYESAQNMIRAAEARGISPVIRVTDNSETLILRALDIGAKNIQVPQVCTKSDAEKVVNAAYFYPKGERGMCRYVRAADYSSIDGKTHFGTANQQVLTIVHIEGLEGIQNLNEIMSVDGIDVIFLGPYDLSQSCGVPGEVFHKKVVSRMKEAVALAKKKGKILGTFTEDIHKAKMWADLGVQYIAYSVDVGILEKAFSKISKDFGY